MLKSLNILVFLLITATAYADDQAIRKAVAPYLGNATDLKITETPMPGINAVKAGLNVVYVSNDGRYVLGGPLIDIAEDDNLTELSLNESRSAIIKSHLDNMPSYRYPAQNSKHEILVITDLDCGYCRRLHTNIDQYHDAGLSLRYVMLPRAGKDSASYVKTVNAACADNPEQSITAAMNGEALPARQCEHPIDQHIELARALQINGTPMMLLQDGRLLRGLQDPDTLLQLLSE